MMGRSKMMRISVELAEVIGSAKEKLDMTQKCIGKDDVSLVEASKYVAVEIKNILPEKKRINNDGWLF